MEKNKNFISLFFYVNICSSETALFTNQKTKLNIHLLMFSSYFAYKDCGCANKNTLCKSFS